MAPKIWIQEGQAENEKDWLIEVPSNVDPMTDMFAQKKFDKKERVAKNELQRLQNIAKANKVKFPEKGLLTNLNPDIDHLSAATSTARKATASHGVFQQKLSKEKIPKKKGVKKIAPMESLDTERKRNLDILENLGKKTPTLDINKAVNVHLYEEAQEASYRKKTRAPKMDPSKKRTTYQAKSKDLTGPRPRSKKARRAQGRRPKKD